MSEPHIAPWDAEDWSVSICDETKAAKVNELVRSMRACDAAPELVEALREALSLIQGHPDVSLSGSDHWVWEQSTRALLARIDGEQA
jgi:hypothetical protein